MENSVNVARYWWIFLVAGIIGVAAGIVALVYPQITVGVIAIIIGVYFLISGLIELVAGIADDEADGGVRVFAGLLGVVSLIAGVVVLRHPGESLLTIAFVVGLWFIVVGAINIFRAFGRPDGRGMAITIGVLDLIVGIIIAAWPHIGITTLVVFIGIMFILRGLWAIYLAFQVKKLKDAGGVAVAV